MWIWESNSEERAEETDDGLVEEGWCLWRGLELELEVALRFIVGAVDG